MTMVRSTSGRSAQESKRPDIEGKVVPFRAERLPAPALQPWRPIAAGMAILLTAVVGFGIWAVTAPIDGAIVAQGTIIFEGKRKSVQHLEGGIVGEILAKDGDRVRAGDVLVRLDPTRAQASSSIIENQLNAARALDARLVAERDNAAAIDFGPELGRHRGEPQVGQLLALQERQFRDRRTSIENQVSILNSRVQQFRAESRGLDTQQKNKDVQINLIGSELVGLKELNAKGWVPITRILALEREAARLRGDRGADVAGMARIENSIGEARLQIIQTRQKFGEDVLAQLRETQNQVAELSSRLIAAQDSLRRIDILAPETGMVQGSRVLTVGGVMMPGQELMQIVPFNDRLQIEAHIQPQDIESVVPGQISELRFTALNQRTTPVIDGTVTLVSADRFVDEKANIAYFLATVDVPPAQLAKLAGHRLQAGMPVDVLIKTGERTFLQYLLKPLSDTLARSFRER
jgi:HlyD family type I secretion membrane fusion protein